jgi:hypothetical protein
MEGVFLVDLQGTLYLEPSLLVCEVLGTLIDLY